MRYTVKKFIIPLLLLCFKFSSGHETTQLQSKELLAISACTSAPGQPSAISGSVNVCSSSAKTYSVAAVNGATAYVWQLPQGWTGTSTTNVITCTPAVSGIMTVAATNSCGISPTQTINITVAPANMTITSTSNTICLGQSATITVTGANGYTWNTGSNAASVVVTPTAFTSYTCTGSFTNGCITTSVRNITVNPVPSMSVSASSSSICVGEQATLTATGAPNINWNPGTSGTSITVSPVVTTIYSVTGTMGTGCSKTVTFSLVVDPCTGIDEKFKETFQLSLFPIPSSDLIRMNASVVIEELIISDLQGREIFSLHPHSLETILDISGLSDGVYTISVRNGDTITFRKMIKEN